MPSFEFDRTTWRLLLSKPLPGAWNMAIDSAILDAVTQGKALPTLRLYSWKPPAISLGSAQSAADVDLDALRAHGWELVRRPTGGKALLNMDELTYSVIGPENEPRLRGGVLESYRRIAAALAAALRIVGAPVEIHTDHEKPTEPYDAAICFEVPSSYEIVVDGRKLVGSAQARHAHGILQHGSIPLAGDLGRITEVLRFASPQEAAQALSRLKSRALTLQEALGRVLDWQELAKAVIRGFCDQLALDLQPSFLTPWERDRARELVEQRYANDAWTFRL